MDVMWREEKILPRAGMHMQKDAGQKHVEIVLIQKVMLQKQRIINLMRRGIVQ